MEGVFDVSGGCGSLFVSAHLPLFISHARYATLIDIVTYILTLPVIAQSTRPRGPIMDPLDPL